MLTNTGYRLRLSLKILMSTIKLSISFLKLIYGTWLVKIAKEINRFKQMKTIAVCKSCLTQKGEIKVIQNFRKIAKIKCREICELQNREIQHVAKISCNKVHIIVRCRFFLGFLMEMAKTCRCANMYTALNTVSGKIFT